MYLKLYQKQIRTNNIIGEGVGKMNMTIIEYIFIIENDVDKKYYMKNRYVDNGISFVQLSIEKGNSNGENIDVRKWTINSYFQIYKNVYETDKDEELEKLFNDYIRKEKINKLI